MTTTKTTSNSQPMHCCGNTGLGYFFADPPTAPARHGPGDFVCLPWYAYPHGSQLHTVHTVTVRTNRRVKWPLRHLSSRSVWRRTSVGVTVATGFAVIYAFDLRRTGIETSGGPIWWNHLRSGNFGIRCSLMTAPARQTCPDAESRNDACRHDLPPCRDCGVERLARAGRRRAGIGRLHRCGCVGQSSGARVTMIKATPCHDPVAARGGALSAHPRASR